jgi:mannosyltransferase
MLVGAYLRFTNLGTPDLSADEAASWAAASARSVGEVLRRQAHLNPGELGLHDLALHWWMAFFGDSLATMRALSAAAATVAIILVFLATHEFLTLRSTRLESDEASDASPESAYAVDMIAAVATLVFAVNLVTIKYAREARMYPFALVITLGQLIFFLRMLRTERLTDGLATALLTALTIGSTYTAGLILIPEGLYLGLLFVTKELGFSKVLRSALLLSCGVIAVAPLYLMERQAGGGPILQTWDWIKRPPLWATISLFNKATGTYGFPLLAILAASGAVRTWSRWRNAIAFMLMWILAPPLFLTLASYVFHPAFVERYLLSCFVPFFMLAALGLSALEPASMRPAAAALVVAIALAHVVTWGRKQHGVAWSAATRIAAEGLSSTDTIGVAPHYAKATVSYYLRNDTSAPKVEASNATPPPTVVIIEDNFHKPEAVSLASRYPRLLAHPDGLMVRGH